MKKSCRRARLRALTILTVLLLAGIYALGLLIPEEASAGDYLSARQPPTLEHPFGTDTLGRDLLARTLQGLSVSLTVGIGTHAIAPQDVPESLRNAHIATRYRMVFGHGQDIAYESVSMRVGAAPPYPEAERAAVVDAFLQEIQPLLSGAAEMEEVGL